MVCMVAEYDDVQMLATNEGRESHITHKEILEVYYKVF